MFELSQMAAGRASVSDEGELLSGGPQAGGTFQTKSC